MKGFLTLAVCLALLVSCKKQQTQKDFSGRYEYATFIGYPFDDRSLPPGNGRIIALGGNGIFGRFSHDTLLFKGTYQIGRKMDCGADEKKNFFYSNDSSFVSGFVIDLRNDSLFLSTPACYADGGVSIYKRLPVTED